MKLLTAKEVSSILNVSLPRVYELSREKSLPSVRLGRGRQVRFDEDALREWIAVGGSAQSNGGNGHSSSVPRKRL